LVHESQCAERVRYSNPFSGEIYEVSLLPEDTHAIVFWSKNYGPLLEYLDDLESRGFDFYFSYTITGLPKDFERQLIPIDKSINIFKTLSDHYSPEHVQWRYDPIFISEITNTDYHKRQFSELAKNSMGYKKVLLQLY